MGRSYLAPPRLVLITDPAFGDELIVRRVEQFARVLPPGALCVQLRDKSRASPSLRMFAWALRTVTRAVGATLVVNGHPEIARDVGADGVHLGSASLEVGDARRCVGAMWVSVAAHSDADVARAIGAGADAVLVSAIFDSRPPGPGGSLKRGRGVGALRSACAIAGRVPVFALGGIDAHNARACREAGAYGVAVMKSLLSGEAPGRAARTLHDAIAPRW